MSLARLVAGAAQGGPFADPVTVKGVGILGKSGVDELAYGLLTFADGVTAEVAAAITRTMDRRAETLRYPQMLFAFEAEAASRAIAKGAKSAPYPAISPTESIGNNTTLDRWRAELGYVSLAEDPGLDRALPPLMPKGAHRYQKAGSRGSPCRSAGL